jgi:hypothetical protein
VKYKPNFKCCLDEFNALNLDRLPWGSLSDPIHMSNMDIVDAVTRSGEHEGWGIRFFRNKTNYGM